MGLQGAQGKSEDSARNSTLADEARYLDLQAQLAPLDLERVRCHDGRHRYLVLQDGRTFHSLDEVQAHLRDALGDRP